MKSCKLIEYKSINPYFCRLTPLAFELYEQFKEEGFYDVIE